MISLFPNDFIRKCRRCNIIMLHIEVPVVKVEIKKCSNISPRSTRVKLKVFVHQFLYLAFEHKAMNCLETKIYTLRTISLAGKIPYYFK